MTLNDTDALELIDFAVRTLDDAKHEVATSEYQGQRPTTVALQYFQRLQMVNEYLTQRLGQAR